MHQPIVLATANADKVIEIRELLSDLQLIDRPLDVPDVDETENTLVGNARLKAIALVNATGKPAVADDTGLEVDVLDGEPGVYSARYAGEHASYADNVYKLLSNLEGVAPAERTAHFRTVALLRYPDGSELIAEGVVDGHIAEAPTRGGCFGYDPVFVPVEGDGRSFAQMSLQEKNLVSHRGRAFRALRALIGS